MDKKICDGCGEDITDKEYWEAEIYNSTLEKNDEEADLCKKCMKELKKHFPK